MHLIIDAQVKCWLSHDEIRVALGNLTALLKMKPLGEVHIVGSPIGPSAVQFIIQQLKESHIAINYINDYIGIDIFSCKDFDSVKATDFCIEYFELVKIYQKELIFRYFGLGETKHVT